MITFDLIEEDAILVVSPEGPLQSADFEEIALQVDPFIERHGQLKGLMIYVENFPGWDSFGALVSHLKFVKDHHKYIKKIAAVSDEKLLSILPKIASHFVNAKIEHFEYIQKEQALNWLREAVD